MKKLTFFLSMLLLMFAACDPVNPPVDDNTPTISITGVSEITAKSAHVGVLFKSNGVVFRSGIFKVQYATEAYVSEALQNEDNPTWEPQGSVNVTFNEDGSGHADLVGLENDTKYVVIAMANINNIVYTSDTVHFTTLEADKPDDPIDAPEGGIDLGIGIIWATCNLGATRDVEFGNYYQWGDIEPATTPSPGYFEGYKWAGKDFGFFRMTKYVRSYKNALFTGEVPEIDGKYILELEDDAAHVAWGGKWRMPTAEEWHALKNRCTVEETIKEGVKGYKFTGPNGNSIFLPSAGHDLTPEAEPGAFYWGSTLSEVFDEDLYACSFCPTLNNGTGIALKTVNARFFEFSIRPVYADYEAEYDMVTTAGFDTASVSPVSVTAYMNVNPYLDLGTLESWGFCWSADNYEPTVDGEHSTLPASSLHNVAGSYVIKGLRPNTSYNVRAYANVAGSVYYGRSIEITTIDHQFVVTGDPAVKTSTSMRVYAQLDMANAKYNEAEFGVCYSKTNNPTVNDQTAKLWIITNQLQNTDVENLDAGAIYYLRAYLKLDNNIFYGDVAVADLSKVDDQDEQLVDLGLSVKWAGWNIGASAPEEVGDFFAWGETEPKSVYHTTTYKFISADKYTKYVTDKTVGTVDGKSVLEAEDDAATANWGNGWRMPTSTEFKELIDKCTWEATTKNSMNGLKVTGPSGKSIFIPLTGYKSYEYTTEYIPKYTGAGSNAYYWSVNGKNRTSSAMGVSSYGLTSDMQARYYGFPVRAVHD